MDGTVPARRSRPIDAPATHIVRRLTAAALAAAFGLALSSASPAPAAADGGAGFVSMANGYRTDESRAPVAFNAKIDRIAIERAEEMAAEEDIGHDFDALKESFDEEGVCWRGFGEIVARNGDSDVAGFGDQWWNSAPHKSVMLGDYTHASGSRASGGDGRWYGVMIFVKLCDAPATSVFTDIGGSKFFDDIVWLVDEGITSGCSANRFCPDGLVTRAQMASFLARALDLPDRPGATTSSTTRATSTRSTSTAFAEAEITAGCDDRRFCPSGLVTRAQMATFLARALHLPAASRDYFSDDNDSSHEANINRIAAAGITGGCGGSRFCPDGVVTRGQMAAFLHRAFD